MLPILRHPVLFCLLAFAPTSVLTARGQVVINEIMQSNIDCVMDNLNEYPDSWVELRNTGTASVSLNRYRLGLTDDYSTAWRLPSQTLAAGGYILVYCDKAATGLHADFRLDSGKGGAVYLFEDSKQVDAVTKIPKQPAPNVSYARLGTGNDTHWGYPYAPSPRSANGTLEAKGVLGDPIFSIQGGVTTSRELRKLTLTIPEGAPAGTVVRYTTDGSEPTASSNVANVPISMTSTRVVRAKAFCEGWISPRSSVQSYIVMDHETELPVVSIVSDDKNFYNNQIGILVDGNYSGSQKNYQYDWRRPMNIEVYEGDGTTCAINQLCEGRVMGAASRGAALKSLAIYANKRFGTKRFDYEFFPDQRPGQTNYKSFLLRNAGNDFDYLYMRDAVIQRTMASHVDLDWQAWRPAIVYINGTYKGILNFRDRSNDDNIFTYYDELEDIDMVKNGYELQQGTWDNYNAFKAFYNEHGHTWDEYAKWIDLDEYINVMAMNMYYGNVDFPGNNIVFWRPRTEGGRWRIIAKDVDYALGIYDMQNTYNMVEWINNHDYDGSHNWANDWDHTRLFRRLMEEETFRKAFIERSAIYMGDFMNESGTRAVWDRMYNMIKDEYPIHRALYNRWWPNYDDELSKARKWLAGRTEQHYQHLAKYYNLGTPCSLTINPLVEEEKLLGARYTFNGVELSKGDFSGKFFAGQNICLEAHPATPADLERYRDMVRCSLGLEAADAVPDQVRPLEVVGWRVMWKPVGGTTTTQTYEGSRLDITMPECSLMQIKAILEVPEGVEEVLVESAAANSPSAVYDLQGRTSQGARPAGVYLRRDASGNVRKVVLK